MGKLKGSTHIGMTTQNRVWPTGVCDSDLWLFKREHRYDQKIGTITDIHQLLDFEKLQKRCYWPLKRQTESWIFFKLKIIKKFNKIN